MGNCKSAAMQATCLQVGAWTMFQALLFRMAARPVKSSSRVLPKTISTRLADVCGRKLFAPAALIMLIEDYCLFVADPIQDGGYIAAFGTGREGGVPTDYCLFCRAKT